MGLPLAKSTEGKQTHPSPQKSLPLIVAAYKNFKIPSSNLIKVENK